MSGWEVSLQGSHIVLDLSDGVRTVTRVMLPDEADELCQALTELIIESDLDACEDDEDWLEDDEDEAA